MEDRITAIAEAMDDIRAIDGAQADARAAVEAIRDRLLEQVGQPDLFPLDAFLLPREDEAARSILYRLAQDDDDRFALYANSSRGRVSTPAHNHTTWAVVVGFQGEELNKFYRRTADGGVEQVDELGDRAGAQVAERQRLDRGIEMVG